ncbi:MAG: hypothetical protein AAGA54_14745 [Myxococcota bacterium]
MLRHRTFAFTSSLLGLLALAGCDDGSSSGGAAEGSTGAAEETGDPQTTANPSSTAGSTAGPSSSSAGSTSAETGVDDTGETGDATDATGSQGAAPEVTLTSPRANSASAAQLVIFEGSVSDPDGDVESLTLDAPDATYTVELEDDGSFRGLVPLAPGPGDYTLTAADADGNEGSTSVPVHFGHRVSVGNSQAAYLREGTLYTWGRNELGQLGNGTLLGSAWGDDPSTADLPLRYELDTDGLISVVTRQTFMVALRDDGSVLTWGDNESGQLGQAAPADCGNSGTIPCLRVPTEVPGISNAIAIGAGFDHTLVLLDDGSVLSFGSNEYGQLGDAAAGPSRMDPAAVPGLEDVVQVAAGSDVSYAVLLDGSVYAWGENDRGQLGQGTTDGDAHPTPTVVDGVEDVLQVAAANTTAFALLGNGTVLAWGRNHAGQAGVGDDSGDDVLAPTAVVVESGDPLENVVSISGDGFVGMALTHDGTVYAWGLGALGQLGQGFLAGGERDLDNRVYASPVAVDRADARAFDILEIEGGAGGPSLAYSTDQHLFGWGWSFQGSLGLEGAINAWAYSAPVLVFAAD